MYSININQGPVVRSPVNVNGAVKYRNDHWLTTVVAQRSVWKRRPFSALLQS